MSVVAAAHHIHERDRPNVTLVQAISTCAVETAGARSWMVQDPGRRLGRYEG
jgi:hypothetical protein